MSVSIPRLIFFSPTPVLTEHHYHGRLDHAFYDHSFPADHDNRERAKDLMPPGQESLVILIDYKTTTLRTNPSISIARKVSLHYSGPLPFCDDT